MKITLYGNPQIGSDSKKILINRYSKKEVVTHSAEYHSWRNSLLKQLRHKYKLQISCNITIDIIFHLKKEESRRRLEECAKDIIECLVICKTFSKDSTVVSKISQEITDELQKVEIII